MGKSTSKGKVMEKAQVEVAKPFNKTEFIEALSQGFATTVKKVYINSLQKEVGFREIKVKEQKTLSRIMVDNEQRKDIIYDTQCALIAQVCLDKDLDIYSLTEFDKTKLLMALYQSNMYKTEIKFTCKQCHTDNVYRMNFANVVRKLDSFDTSDKIFDFENENWKFTFKLGYPLVRRVSEFYKSYAKQYRMTAPQQLESLNNSINMDYMNNFVKEVKIVNKADGSEQNIDMAQFTPDEVNQIFASFPQDVLYVDNGVLNFIATEFIAKPNECFDKHKCAQCGTIYEEAVDKDTGSFF